MKPFLFFFILVLTAFTLAACDAIPDGYGRVTGTVVWARSAETTDERNPADKAIIEFVDKEGSIVASARSMADGNWSLEVPFGTYVVRGHTSETGDHYSGQLDKISVHKSSVHTNSMLLLPAGEILGKAVLADTDDASGITVYLPGLSIVSMTDISGDFRLLYVPPGTYDVTASKTGYQSVTASATAVSAGVATTIPTPLTLHPSNESALLESVILDGPQGQVNTAVAIFSFAVRLGESARFECSLDNGVFRNCTSPVTYTTLSNGEHTFQVRALADSGSAESTPASATWTVQCTSTSPADSTCFGACIRYDFAKQCLPQLLDSQCIWFEDEYYQGQQCPDLTYSYHCLFQDDWSNQYDLWTRTQADCYSVCKSNAGPHSLSNCP